MPGIRGESVGTAYVRIIADGSGIPDDIRDELKKAEPGLEQLGEKHSAAYQDGFAKQMAKEDINSTLIERLHAGLGRFDREGQFMGVSLSEGIRDELNRAFPQGIGDQIFKDFEEDINSGRLHVDRLGDAFEDLRPRVTRALREIQRQERETLIPIRESLNDIIHDISLLEQGEKKGVRSRRELQVATASLVKTMHDLGVENHELQVRIDDTNRHLKRMGTLANVTRRHFIGLDDRMGRLFGKGSRSEFLNFVGSLARAFTRLILTTGRLVFKLGENLFDLGKKLTGFFTSIGELGLKGAFQTSFTSANGLIATLAGTLATGGLNLLGFAVAMGIATLAAGLLTAALSLLLGVVVALVSTISFAFIGSLGALAGTILPIVAGIAGIALAIKGLDDEMKKSLKETIRPMTEAFNDLAKASAITLFKDAEQQSGLIAEILKDLRPLILGSTAAVRDVVTEMLEATRSKGFRNFIDGFSVFLPRAIRSLGRIFTNLFGGLGGLFLGMRPITRDFLGWLEDITQQFSDWANSVEGQKEIKAFFEDAGDSARALGDAISSISDVIGKLLGGGRETGDSIFTSIADTFDRIGVFFDENPDALRDWFEDARKFATELGGLVSSLTAAFDALDNPATRKLITDMINLFADIVNVVAKVIKWLDEAGLSFADLVGLMNPLVGVARRFWGVLSDLWPVIKKVWEWANNAWDAFNDLEDKIPGLAEALGGLLGPLGSIVTALDDIVGGVKSAIEWLNRLHQRDNPPGPLLDGSSPDAGPRGIIGDEFPDDLPDARLLAGPTNNITFNVITPTTDPAAVATEVVNRLVATAY